MYFYRGVACKYFGTYGTRIRVVHVVESLAGQCWGQCTLPEPLGHTWIYVPKKTAYAQSESSMPSRWTVDGLTATVVPTAKQQATDDMNNTIKVRLMEAIMGQLKQFTARPPTPAAVQQVENQPLSKAKDVS